MIALPALSSGVDRLQDWFFLVNEPEQLFPHYLLEASLQNRLLSLGHTLFYLHVVLVLPVTKLPSRNK